METKKLTCCDLMVGDYVYSTFSDKPCKVQAIELSEHEYCSVRVSGVEGVKDIVSLSPIPLTAEILEKNGFVYNDLPFVQAWEQYGLSIYGDGLINCGQNVTLKCQYVHQLQHILQDCGIDKTIEL